MEFKIKINERESRDLQKHRKYLREKFSKNLKQLCGDETGLRSCNISNRLRHQLLSLDEKNPNRINIETFPCFDASQAFPCSWSSMPALSLMNGLLQRVAIPSLTKGWMIDDFIFFTDQHFGTLFALVSLWQKGSLAISLMFHFLVFATHATFSQNITPKGKFQRGVRGCLQKSVGKFCVRWESKQTYGNIFYWYWFMGSARTLCQIFLRGYHEVLCHSRVGIQMELDSSLPALSLQFSEILAKPDTKISESHECEKFPRKSMPRMVNGCERFSVDVVTNWSACGSCSQQCQLWVYLLGILAIFCFRILLINLIGVRYWKGSKNNLLNRKSNLTTFLSCFCSNILRNKIIREHVQFVLLQSFVRFSG